MTVTSTSPTDRPSGLVPAGRDLRLSAPEHRGLVVGVVGVVVAVAFEAIAVATAMPVAARELGGLRAYGLAFSVFLTASLLGMVVAGDAADRRGPVRPFLAAALVFGVGLLAAGLATTMPMLVAARAVQGFGAGLNIVALYVVVARAFPAALRPRVFSAISSGWIVPSLVGPPVAGLVADHASWRWVFLGVIPLLAAAVLLVRPHLAGLDERREPDAREVAVARSARGRLGPAVAVAAGAGAFQYAGQVLTDRPLFAAGLLAAAVGLLAPGVPRLLPPGALRLARGLPSVVVLRGFYAGAFFGAEAFIPLMLVEQRGLATALAGASLTGGAVTWALGSWLQGRPDLRTSRARLVAVGFLLLVAGIGLAGLATQPAVPAATAAVGWALAGLGMGLGLTSLSVLVLELSPVAEQGANSSALQVSDALGSILLIGTAGAVYAGFRAGAGGAAPGAGPFLVIDAVMVAVALGGALAAGRVSPARRGRDTR